MEKGEKKNENFNEVLADILADFLAGGADVVIDIGFLVGPKGSLGGVSIDGAFREFGTSEA